MPSRGVLGDKDRSGNTTRAPIPKSTSLLQLTSGPKDGWCVGPAAGTHAHGPLRLLFARGSGASAGDTRAPSARPPHATPPPGGNPPVRSSFRPAQGGSPSPPPAQPPATV